MKFRLKNDSLHASIAVWICIILANLWLMGGHITFSILWALMAVIGFILNLEYKNETKNKK